MIDGAEGQSGGGTYEYGKPPRLTEREAAEMDKLVYMFGKHADQLMNQLAALSGEDASDLEICHGKWEIRIVPRTD